LRTVARDIQASVEKSWAFTDNSTSNVKTLVDTLPAIFTQLTAIESKLRDLTIQMDATSEEAVSSARLTRNLECIMQHFTVLLLSTIACAVTKRK
jgi:hypothetical protein